MDCGLDIQPSNPQSAIRNPQLAAGVLFLALLGSPASAQQPDSTPKDSTTLAPVVVTGTRLPSVHEVVRGLTGRTATLNASDLDERGVRSLADALEELPGVTTSDELGAPAQLDVTLRGFQVSPTIGLPQGVTVYVDGVRMNEPDANEVNFDLLPLEDVERVEVVYGPSVLLGRNSLGAAVNLVTRRGSAPGAREVEVSGGSYGRYEVKLQAGDRRGNWDYYIGARYEHETGWRQATTSGIGTLFGKLGLIAGGWNATLSCSGAENKIHQAGSLPDNVVDARPDSNFTAGDYFAPTSHLITLNAQLAVNLFGRFLNTDQFNVNASPPDSRQRNHERLGGGAVQLTGSLGLAGRPLRWFGGVDGTYSHTVVGLYAVPPSGADSLTDSVRANEVDWGVFAGASWELTPSFAATVVGRYDYIRLPYEDLLDPTQDGLNLYHRVSPRVGVSWTGLRNQEVYASWSRGFRPAALVEPVGLQGCLRLAVAHVPQHRHVERRFRADHRGVAGLCARPDGEVAPAHRHGVYRTDVRDDIFFVAPTATTGYFQNIAATRRAGVETAIRWASRGGGGQLYANYGYTAATFETTAVLSTGRPPGNETVTPGDRLPMVPAHRFNAGASLPLFKDVLRLRVDGRYIGPQYLRGDEANVEARLPDYALADASLEANVDRYSVRVMVPNVLDRRYVTFGTFAANPTVAGAPVQRFLTPGQPRHLLVSISADF